MVVSQFLAQRNSVAKIAKPKGMKTIAGPGKTNITTPATSVLKPKTDTVSLRQNENGRIVDFSRAERLLRLLIGLLLGGLKIKQGRDSMRCATAVRKI